MVNRTSPLISVESSSNQDTAINSLAGEPSLSWQPSPEDSSPYLKYTVITGDGSNARYFDVSVTVSGVDSIHIYVLLNGQKIDTHFVVSFIYYKTF